MTPIDSLHHPLHRPALIGALATALLALTVPGQAADGPLVSGVDQENFSEKARPHEDFYEHVNGGWLERTEIPADESNYGAFSVLNDEAEAALRKIAEQAAAGTDNAAGSDQQRIGDLYRSFMDVERLNELGLAPIADDLKRIDSIQSKSDLIRYMGSAQMNGINNPLVHYVSPDAKKSDTYIVYLHQAGTALPDRDYYLKDDPRLKKALDDYRKYIVALLSKSGYPDPEGAAGRILDLETRLAEAQWTRVQNRDPVKTYNRLSSEEIAQRMPDFDWPSFARHAGLEAQENLVVRQPSFLEGFNRIYSTTPLDTWKDYLAFHTIDAVAWALGEDYERLHFDFHQRALSGVAEPGPRWKRGIRVLNSNIGELLGKAYVKERFSPDAKRRMAELVENLREAFARRIRQLDWMSQGTKIQALEKLDKVNTKIGYPDRWKDYGKLEIRPGDLVGNIRRAQRFEHDRDLAKLGGPIDRGEWHMTPQTVNAYYNPLLNEIVFPAAILQPPFFNLEADDAVNYGAIGAVIGHELSHGFDDKGSKYDGDGNLRNWWTREDREEFEKRGRQLVEQYAGYAPIDDIHLNGELTLGENIGDLGGLNVAHTAYRLSLGDDESPVIDGLTGDRRFFYGWGQVWRRKYRDEELRRRLLVDPHSPSRYRANGIVSNMDEFYRAFDVKPGQEMFIPREKRVRIW